MGTKCTSQRAIWSEEADAPTKDQGKTPATIAPNSHIRGEHSRASRTYRLQLRNLDSSSESGSELDGNVSGSAARSFDGNEGGDGGATKADTIVLPAHNGDARNKVCAHVTARTC